MFLEICMQIYSVVFALSRQSNFELSQKEESRNQSADSSKYILCKILVSDSVLRKDFFQSTVNEG